MREILFRGKRVIDGNWAESLCPLGEMHSGTVLADFDPATVGQYTGLTDKNGQKIFEGDIVITQYGRKCLVEWFSSPAYCGWDLKPLNDVGKPPYKSTMWAKENLAVIGNSYDGEW